MRICKSANANGKPTWQKPSEEVQDLLMDFGDIEYRGKSVWLILGRRKLPSYLRGSEIAKEARRWVMVLSTRSRAVLHFKRGNIKRLEAMKVRA